MSAADDRAREEIAAARVHELKVWPSYFDALADGSKTFEMRRDDRGFAVGDVLRLREWQQPIPDWDVKGGYTGREVTRSVSYVLDVAEDFGLTPGFVVLGLAGPLADLVAERDGLEAVLRTLTEAVGRGDEHGLPDAYRAARIILGGDTR